MPAVTTIPNKPSANVRASTAWLETPLLLAVMNARTAAGAIGRKASSLKRMLVSRRKLLLTSAYSASSATRRSSEVGSAGMSVSIVITVGGPSLEDDELASSVAPTPCDVKQHAAWVLDARS